MRQIAKPSIASDSLLTRNIQPIKHGSGEITQNTIHYQSAAFNNVQLQSLTIIIAESVFLSKNIQNTEYKMRIENNILHFELSSYGAMCALRDYIEMETPPATTSQELCPISLRVPRDPCYIEGSRTHARYEREALEHALTLRPMDPMTGEDLINPVIREDAALKSTNRNTNPFALADLIADYYCKNKPSGLITPLPPRTRTTDMRTAGNPLIAEFLDRFNEEVQHTTDNSPDVLRQALYEILQDYQRSIRTNGVRGDWTYTRQMRAGFFYSTHKSFIFEGGLSIQDSRERLFLVDGLTDTTAGSDVLNPTSGSLLHALSPEKGVINYIELQQILEYFAQDEPLIDPLKTRCTGARIDSSKTRQALLGAHRLGELIHFVRTALELHYKNERIQIMPKKPTSKSKNAPSAKSATTPTQRSGFRLSKSMLRRLTAVKPRPPQPRKTALPQLSSSSSSTSGGGCGTFLILAAAASSGCAAGCGGGGGCGASGCGGNGCGGSASGCGGNGCGGSASACGGGGGCGAGCGGGCGS